MDDTDDGGVDDAETMLVALQGRIVALERLVLALLTEMTMRNANGGKYEKAAEMVRKTILASAQHMELPDTPITDEVWEWCGKSLRLQLNNLVLRAKALDG